MFQRIKEFENFQFYIFEILSQFKWQHIACDMTFFLILKGVSSSFCRFFFNHFAIYAMNIIFFPENNEKQIEPKIWKRYQKREGERVQQIEFRERKENWHGKRQREFFIEWNKVEEETIIQRFYIGLRIRIF